MSSTIVTGSYRQSGTIRCLPKQGIISAQLSQITGNVKQKNGKENVIIRLNRPMERKGVYTQELGVYPSQGEAEQEIHDMTASSKAFR